MKLIQVLGTGCAKCDKLKQNAKAAVALAGIEATVEKIEDINVIAGFGVMMTPALAVDGEVKVVGKVPPPEEIRKLIE
ncbi:MAG: TM0996/MTH895 family glutaredoxin-like protein [Pirellulales bacterium]|nr:TM0996/MTH895 family glutaredoxin-like protein [Pirellulales bacterium]